MKLYETAELEAELFDGSAELENFSEEEYIENLEDIPSLELTLELADGRTLIYELAGVFIHEEKEYAALHPKTDTEGIIHLMELAQGEDDELRLLPIADDEWDAVSNSFYKYMSDDPYENMEHLEVADLDNTSEEYIENMTIKGE